MVEKGLQKGEVDRSQAKKKHFAEMKKRDSLTSQEQP